MATDREGGVAAPSLPDRLIVGPERARRQFTALVQQAQKSIQIIDAKMSDPGIIDLLNQRRAQGINVEIFGQKRLGTLLSHGKMMLVDGARAVVGSLALIQQIDALRDRTSFHEIDDLDAFLRLRGVNCRRARSGATIKRSGSGGNGAMPPSQSITMS